MALVSSRRLLLALVLVAGLAAGIELLARGITLDMLRARVEADLEDGLGLPVSIGKLRLSVLPRPSLYAQRVEIANPPGRSAANLLEVDEVRLGLAPWPFDGSALRVVELELAGGRLQLEVDPEKGHGVSPDVGELASDTKDHDVALYLRRVAIEDLRVFRRWGSDGPVRSLEIHSLQLDAEGLEGPVSFSSAGRVERAEFELEGRGGSLEQLRDPDEPYPIHLTGMLFEAELELEGTIVDPFTLSGVDLALSAEIPDLVLAGRPLPGLGPIAFHARVSDLDGSLGLERFDVTTRRREPLDVDVDGSVDDLLDLSEVRVAARVAAKHLDFLDELIDARIPAVDSAEADLKLSDEDGSLGLEGSARVSTPDERIVVSATGRYGDLTRLADVGVDLVARARHLDVVRDLVEDLPPMPEIGPLNLRGRLLDRNGRLALSGLELLLGRRDDVWLSARGELDDLLDPDGVEFEVEFGARSAQRLAALFGRELPPLGRVEGGARVTDRDGSFGIEDFRARILDDEGTEIRLSGTLDDLEAWDDLELAVDLRVRDLAVLGALVGRELPARGPVEFQGQVRGSNESAVGDPIALRIGETKLQGSLAGSFATAARPLLRASIESPHVRLQDLGLAPDSEPEPDGDAKRLQQPAAADDLPFEQLRAFDLDLRLNIARVTGYAGLDLRDVQAQVVLDDGHLQIADVAAVYKLGEVRGELRVDARTPTAELALRVDASGVDIGRLMSQFEEQTEFSGLADLSIDLGTSGRTSRELREKLSGRFDLALRDGTAASKIARRFTVDLIRTVFPEITPQRAPRIGCAIAAFEIESGLARVETLLLREGEVTVTGTGEIDLIEGFYQLRMTPSTTNPALLGVTPQVRVAGPLMAPEFRPVRRTLATSLLSGLGSNARRAGMLLLRPFGSRTSAIEQGQAACGRIGAERAARAGDSGDALAATARAGD